MKPMKPYKNPMMKKKMTARPGVEDPGALGAFMGAKKYGPKMPPMAAKGRKG